MFKDLKEYQEITQIYNDSVNISEEQRAINKIFIEEGFTSEEIEWLEENFDELWENELAQYTQDCIVECYEGQDLTEEQIQQIDEVLGLRMLAKGITKAAPAISKGLRKANIGIKKGIKAVGKKVSGGAKAIGTGIKDTARGAVSVGKSALKKVGGAIKKAAPIIGKGALLGTGAALPIAAGVGIVKGVNALRKRGKAKREAGKAAADAALDAKIKAGIDKAGMGVGKGTAMTAAGIAQAKANRLEYQKKKAAEAGKSGAQALKDKTTKTNNKSLPDIDKIAATPRSEIKKSGRTAMIKKNIDRFGKDRVQHLQNKQVDFKKMRSKEMSKDEFIKKYPNSITAQRAKGLRDHAEWDSYDMVLEYLFSTEQVTTLEEANYVMMEMDQQTVGEIVTEVKQELHELLPLAGLALGVNALRKRGKAKREGKGGSPFKPAGTAAGRSALAPMKKVGGAAGKAAAGAIDTMTGGAAGKAAGSIASRMPGVAAAAGGAKPQSGTGRTSPRPPHGRRPGGGSIGGIPPKPEAKKIDLSGKSKAQIMALKRLGKI
tara:strand:- start:246 stop:1883 length:1638 start_codon:yes stop_codon:yes gene_type:complete